MEENFNLNAYKYFLAVIREQSVSKAAGKLGVSQPTVSYNLHTLQRELGKRLFILERNGIVPSPQALILYQRLRPVYLAFMRIIADFVRNEDCQ